VFTVGLGPASADPTFGCGGAVDLALTAALGPDPLPCSQATGPVKASASSGVPTAASGSVTGVSAASLSRLAGTALVPVPTVTATSDSLSALLIPLLAG
jgi:hypothetical protein